MFKLKANTMIKHTSASANSDQNIIVSSAFITSD